ncbi:UTP--glucose-1-phosphate uridylyltransferase GalU [Methanothrix thermoacetophila]|uniref:UTP--glucose-1-phosphate uridylyltransferase n=1 Tax=Methanothrix thermoacetophila (strain DSM 6194 / JCM 14653 / NBRC 101360 / PT) TaxID=349307 RepID=A0B839_METTP|nr:UTP--glucose-1-phosphate uridylyltransferase GalU [Methanothrix thermoacetophila]ABK14863.1 UDP-glucose pyrophosphorylase [Methanothrix thermoacetophila PT]
MTERGYAGDGGGILGNPEIRKAVIPAAGQGTRFLPITRAQPKEMLPVVDKPVIQYVVEEAISSGIEDILIITGRGKRAIEDHFDVSCELEKTLLQKNDAKLYDQYRRISDLADIHYIRQKEPRGLGDAILHAERHCDGEPFAVLLGDTITVPYNGSEPCTSQMIKFYKKYHSTIVAVERVPKNKIQDYGIIDGTLLEDGVYKITDIVEKPSPEVAPSDLGAIGRYILMPEIFDILRTIKPGHGGEIQLTDALKCCGDAIGLVTRCRRYDIGDKISWMKSSLELALARDEFADELRRFMKSLLKE